MRTRSALDVALLQSPAAARSTYCRVEVDRTGSGDWVDLSAWHGLDFVRSVQFTESVNSPAWSATIAFALYLQDRTELSLSPLMAGSLPNSGGILLSDTNPIRVSTSTVPIDDSPSTYNLVFRGRIDKWSIAGDQIVVTARNEIGDLQDRFVEKASVYGDDDPTTATANELQEIIQNIIDDHYNTASDISGTASAPRANKLSARTTDGSPVQLYSANGSAATPWNASDDTGWSLRVFQATKAPVWTWIDRLTKMIGYRLHYRWHNGSGIDDFVLVLELPNRASPSSVITIDPSLGQCRIVGVEMSVLDVRNVWRVGYVVDVGTDDSVEVSDATSITAHRRRFAEAFEGSASQIDDSTEATAMANALLANTKEPVATVRVILPYIWYLETNDIMTVNADNIHFDSAQTLCLIQRENLITQGGPAVSTLTLHGELETNGTRPPQREYSNPRKESAAKVGYSNYSDLIGNCRFAYGDII